MACFLVGGGEAIIGTAVREVVKKKEMDQGIIDEHGNQLTDPAEDGICWTRKIGMVRSFLSRLSSPP